MKRRLADAALVLLSLALCFAACEWIFRQLPASDRLGWVNLPPPAERARAFVGEIASHPAPVLLGLGDSFTEFRERQGENYVHEIARSAKADGNPLAVLNLGEAGTGLVDYVRNFCAASGRLHVDIAVFGIYLGNDLLDSDLSVDERNFTGCTLQDEKSEGWRDFLKRSSIINAVYRLAKLYAPALRSGMYERTLDALHAAPETIHAGEAKMDPNLLDRARADAINTWDAVTAIVTPDVYRNLYALDTADMRQRAETFAHSLAVVTDRCRQLSIRCLYVLIPPAAWIGPDYQDYFARLGYTMPDLTAEPPLPARLAASGETLDLLPLFRKSEIRDIFIADDTHLNPKGQRLVGAAIYKRLTELGWIRHDT